MGGSPALAAMRSAKRRKLRPASSDLGRQSGLKITGMWMVCGVVMSRLKILKHFESPKPSLKHHFPAFFYRFSSFSYETFYNSFCRQRDSSSIPGPVILHLAWCMATWHQVVKIGCFRDDKQLSHETIQMCVESGKSNAKNHPH